MDLQETQFGGVIPTLFAEGEEGGGLDLGNGGGDGGEDLDLGDGGQGDGGEGTETGGQENGEGEGQGEDRTDGRLGSKEFREALKAWEATPEGAKFAKQVRADFYRARELQTIEPGGVTAVREKYALLESVGGPEAITTLQERVAQADGLDEAIVAGDVKALESMGPEFDAGLAKLTPNILDRVMRADPTAYAAAILPHLMSSLSGSPMVKDLNGMIDVLQAPHLDEKGKLDAITKLLGRIGAWYDANEKKAGEIKQKPVDAGRQELDQQRTQLDQQQQELHWKSNIQPGVAQYESGKFEELFRPFQAKLKLDPAAKADLFGTFRQKMSEAGKADKAYMSQMAIYRKQKNPDPAQVQNFVKAAINRHAKSVVEAATKARYGKFLGAPAGARQGQQQQKLGTRQPGPVGGQGQVTVVSVKPTPEQIDYRRTSEADQWNKVYTLKDGKRVKWVKPA